MTEKEQWKPIYGYEGKYEISSFGRVKSLPKTWKRKDGVPLHYKERILKPRINAYGYARVNLCKNGKPKDFFIHRLVASAFIRTTLDGMSRVKSKARQNAISELINKHNNKQL